MFCIFIKSIGLNNILCLVTLTQIYSKQKTIWFKNSYKQTLKQNYFVNYFIYIQNFVKNIIITIIGKNKILKKVQIKLLNWTNNC